MFPGLKRKNIIFSFLITILQISVILSNEEKCYSIKNCLKCPELDICDQCKPGFTLSKPKTKCNGKKSKSKEPKVVTQSKPNNTPAQNAPAQNPPAQNPPAQNAPAQNAPAQNSPAQNAPAASPAPSKKENPFLNKPAISVNKAPNNPFQNVPISSFQRFKDKDANNQIINKILIFILIILVLSIIASVIYNFVKKKMNNGYVDDGQEETAKVVYIR